MSRTQEAITDDTVGVTAFIPSDYLLGQFAQLCSLLAPMTELEQQRCLKPALRRLNAWERGTLIGTLRFLIASMPKAAQSKGGE